MLTWFRVALEEALRNALHHGNLELESTLREEDNTKYLDLIICNVSSVGREILQTAKFYTLWDIYESREEAMSRVKAA